MQNSLQDWQSKLSRLIKTFQKKSKSSIGELDPKVFDYGACCAGSATIAATLLEDVQAFSELQPLI